MSFGSRPGRTLPSATHASDLLYPPATASSDHAITDAVGAVARARGVSRAQVALAWLHAQPVVAAPLVGAGTTGQIDEAVASVGLRLTDAEIQTLEASYTPRYDWQGVSDEDQLQAIRERIPQFSTAS